MTQTLPMNLVLQWRNQGYAVWDDLPKNIVESARDMADFSKSSNADSGDFGSLGGVYEFPSGVWELDRLPLSLLDIARQLLGVKEIILSQADCWIKRVKQSSMLSNKDQRMHCDWGNNQLIPSDWDAPDSVSVIVYLDGPEECSGGGTALVPRKTSSDQLYHSDKLDIQPGYGDRPFLNNRVSAENWFRKHNPSDYHFRQQLYQREKIITPKRGRVLFYRLDTWHRGIPLTEGSRRVYSLVFQKAEETSRSGRWNCGFWKNSYYWRGGKHNIYKAPEKTFAKMTPDQRTCIGIPPPSNSWWTLNRLLQVKKRIPEFDYTPYLSRL